MENIVLLLLCIPKIGNKITSYILNEMCEYPKDEKELLDVIIQAKMSNKKVVIPTLEEIKYAMDKSKYIIQKSKIIGINTIDILHNDFPENLKYIDDSPLVLFYKGNYESLINYKSVAIVGSRIATEEGLKMSYKLGYEFGEDGYSVISGLARGCDTYAHKGCLKSKGVTISVLPCGLDSIYPRENENLVKEILDNNGCLVSEYPIETKCFKNNFIKRDRIQSGLSNGVILCESDVNSGSMHTVNFAISQDKVLACLNINAKGNKKVMNEKNCIIINDIKDIQNIKKQILIKSNLIQNKNYESLYSKQLKIKL